MKNLLLLTFAGLGERHNVGAPTFWKTVEGFIAAGWKVWIVDVGTKEDINRVIQDDEVVIAKEGTVLSSFFEGDQNPENWMVFWLCQCVCHSPYPDPGSRATYK